MILEVEVQAGNQITASYTASDLLALLERLPRNHWSQFLRRDCAFGTDGMMNFTEEKGISYLFKLKLARNVKNLVARLIMNQDWKMAGQDWESQESTLRLMGWKKSRRVIVLRKKVPKDFAALSEDFCTGQLQLSFAEIDQDMLIYEYAVLVISLLDEVLAIAQYYRDQADSENIFDELKNQWG